MLRASERLMGCTEVGFVEFSGGLEKAKPLIFQSDYIEWACVSTRGGIFGK